MKTSFEKEKKKLEVLSMLCNIKSLTSRCLIGYRDRWISVSQKSRGKIIISLRFLSGPVKGEKENSRSCDFVFGRATRYWKNVIVATRCHKRQKVFIVSD